MAKTKTISVTFRCPENLHNALSNFALDHNIIKDDKPIISEALIAALRIGLGKDGNTDVSQSVLPSDFEAMITDAIAPLLARIETLEATSREATPSEKNPLTQANLSENDAPPIIEEIAESNDGTDSLINESTSLEVILTRTEALSVAKTCGFKGNGQNLYDWARAALTAKSEESKQSAKEKLAKFGLAPTYNNEGKTGWLAISTIKQGEDNENS